MAKTRQVTREFHSGVSILHSFSATFAGGGLLDL